jgi:hypothetical protein
MRGQESPWGLVEGLVWAEIQGFLRQPQQILARLRQRVKLSEGERQRREQELANQRAQRREKVAERERDQSFARASSLSTHIHYRHAAKTPAAPAAPSSAAACYSTKKKGVRRPRWLRRGRMEASHRPGAYLAGDDELGRQR